MAHYVGLDILLEDDISEYRYVSSKRALYVSCKLSGSWLMLSRSAKDSTSFHRLFHQTSHRTVTILSSYPCSVLQPIMNFWVHGKRERLGRLINQSHICCVQNRTAGHAERAVHPLSLLRQKPSSHFRSQCFISESLSSVTLQETLP